jgi:three-Cys-motif partner protein
MNIYRKLPPATPDDLHTPEVGEWGRQKYLRHWIYADTFSQAMKNSYEHRVYIDLFSGAGKARIRETGELVLGSPLLALSVASPFTRYIFCESNEQNVEALRTRVERDFSWADVKIIHAPVERAVDQIISHLPASQATLNFCFADPFDLEFDFKIVERLSRGRKMDFLMLLAAQMDGQRNVFNYLNAGNSKIERLLNNSEWRAQWEDARTKGMKFQRFLVEEYCNAMERIGYARPKASDAHKVETESGSVPLYYLLFFSKHALGYKFWREALKYSETQRSLFDT